MSITVLDPLPPYPTRADDEDTFNLKVDNYLAAQAGLVAGINQVSSEINAASEIVQANAQATQTAQATTSAAAVTATAAAAAAEAASGLPASPGFGSVLATSGVPQIVAGNCTLQVRCAYEINTAAGALSLLLPAAPQTGDWVWVTDHTGSFARNNCTLLRNGKKIVGLAEDFIIDLARYSGVLVYINDDYGWAIK